MHTRRPANQPISLLQTGTADIVHQQLANDVQPETVKSFKVYLYKKNWQVECYMYFSVEE